MPRAVTFLDLPTEIAPSRRPDLAECPTTEVRTAGEPS